VRETLIESSIGSAEPHVAGYASSFPHYNDPDENRYDLRFDPDASVLVDGKLVDWWDVVKWKRRDKKPRSVIPSIHMKKKFARIWLRIKDIRVERVQDICGSDAMSEGIRTEFLPPDPDNFHPPNSYGYVHSSDKTELIKHTATEAFQELWNSINEKRGFGWNVNPWTWVIEFERCENPNK